jgi:hypothetical protein
MESHLSVSQGEEVNLKYSPASLKGHAQSRHNMNLPTLNQDTEDYNTNGAVVGVSPEPL